MKKRKGIEAQRVKSPPTQSWAIDALIGDEEQSGKQRKEQKERNRDQTPNPSTLGHLVASYDPYGSYGGPIVKSLTRGEI